MKWMALLTLPVVSFFCFQLPCNAGCAEDDDAASKLEHIEGALPDQAYVKTLTLGVIAEAEKVWRAQKLSCHN